jgi:hypothetical protein
MSTGHGDVPLHRNYGTNARYAVRYGSKPSTGASRRAVARGLELNTRRAGSIQDTRKPLYGRVYAPGACPVTRRVHLGRHVDTRMTTPDLRRPAAGFFATPELRPADSPMAGPLISPNSASR